MTRGWAYDQDTEALLDEAHAQVTKALEQVLSSGNADHEHLNRVARGRSAAWSATAPASAR